jgi:hypothetical protein
MRAMHAQSGDLNDVMRMQAALLRHSGAHSKQGGQRSAPPPQRTEPALHSVPPGTPVVKLAA